MVKRDQLEAFLRDYLQTDYFRDYCPNGLQIQGREQIKNILCAVSASQAVVDEAVRQNVDALLVHHGYFWKNENPSIVGMKANRIKPLIRHDINLFAYHLPLDAHAELGNNACLAQLCEADIIDRFGMHDKDSIGVIARCRHPVAAALFVEGVSAALQRQALHIAPDQRNIETVAICSGGAQNYFEAAIAKNVDAFITGEISEQHYHIAMESGVHFIAAGHHATERYGVQALAKRLQEQFPISCSYFEIDNPV